MSVRDRIKMMEQIAKQEKEAAADERGRSPGGASMRSSASNDSPRPLSKVRTSFVAIEKDGRIGLQRQASGDSVFSPRQLSGDTETTSSILQDSSRTNVSSPDTSRSELSRRPGGPGLSPSSIQDAGPTRPAGLGKELSFAQPTKPAASTGPVSGAAGEDVSSAQSPQPAASAGPVSGTSREEISPAEPAEPAPSSGPVLGLAAKLSHTETATGGKSNPAGLAASPQIRQAPRGIKEGRTSTGTDTDFVPSTNGTGPGGAADQGAQENQGAKGRQGQSVRDQSKAQIEGGKDPVGGQGSKGASSVGGPGGNSGASRASGITMALNGTIKTKTPRTGATSSKASASSAQPKATGRPTHPTSKPSTTPPPAGKSAADKKTPSSASPAFVKPRPKSPTRPVELPSRLTQPTAAAAAKNRNAPPPARPASRTSTSTGKGLGRSSSAAGRQRPSVGPPPKQTAKDHPMAKKEARAPDESFLARMMRPTQASASKVAEKVQVPTTPPRKTAATSASKKPTSAQSGPAKRAVSRTVSTTTSAAATPERKDEPSAAQAVARQVEQTPVAEEVIKIANRAEGTMPLKISEENVEAPKTERHMDTAKTTEKENLPMVSEEVDSPKSPDKKLFSPEEKENAPQILTEVPQANGHHEKKPPVGDSKTENDGQPVTSGIATGAQPEVDVDETW